MNVLAPIFAGVLRIIGAPARWLERVEMRERLEAMPERLLADIGIAREDIPLIVKGLAPYPYQPLGTRLWRRWHAMRVRLDGARRMWRERRQVYRELMAYRDRELDEIGIRRSDIARIARGHPARVPAE